MNSLTLTISIFVCCSFLSFLGGCDGGSISSGALEVPADESYLSAYSRFRPSRVDVLPLTRVRRAGDSQRKLNFDVYVALVDIFGSQIKAPAVFRFELYEHVRHSGEPKGRRITIWLEIDLTKPEANNDYWQDFMRTYLFTLDSEVGGTSSFILQVTCICPGGRRLLADYALKVAPD